MDHDWKIGSQARKFDNQSDCPFPPRIKMLHSPIYHCQAFLLDCLNRKCGLLLALVSLLAASSLSASNEKIPQPGGEEPDPPEVVMERAEKAFQRDQYGEARLGLQTLAKKKHPQARTWLGYMYTLGLGVDIDQKKSKKLLMAAARTGSATAARYLRWQFDSGNIDAKDEEEADRIRNLSRDNVKGLGTTHFGWMVVDGESFRNNHPNALDFNLGQAKKEIPRAQYNMGVIYEEARGVPADMKEALAWYRKAADNGHPKAQFRLGKLYQDGFFGEPDFATATKWYQQAADQNHISAQTNLAHLYATGQGVQQSDREALRHYRKAAIRGDMEAQSELGFWYETGREVDKDPLQAVYWLELAAQNGDLRSQARLGQLYLGGRGVNGDSDKALYWLEKAAKRESPVALFALGEMYWRGLGIGEDKEEAFKLYLEAAKLGEPGAQMMVAVYYTHNLNDPKDVEEAAKWMESAAAQGYPEAEFQLALWCYEGFGMRQDMNKFIELLDRAATHGVRRAAALQEHINKSESSIEGAVDQYFDVVQSRKASQKYLRKAAEEAASQVDVKNRPPQPIHARSPKYPKHLKEEDLHGTVTVLLVVDEKGFVVEASVENSFHAEFEQPALDAIQQWRFKPALRDGVPVAKKIRIPMRF